MKLPAVRRRWLPSVRRRESVGWCQSWCRTWRRRACRTRGNYRRRCRPSSARASRTRTVDRSPRHVELAASYLPHGNATAVSKLFMKSVRTADTSQWWGWIWRRWDDSYTPNSTLIGEERIWEPKTVNVTKFGAVTAHRGASLAEFLWNFQSLCINPWWVYLCNFN